MHRTTIRLDEHLLVRAKEYASRHRRSLTAVIEDALRALLARKPNDDKPSTGKGRPRLPVCKDMSGPLPGINLNSHSELLDVMERDLPLDQRR